MAPNGVAECDAFTLGSIGILKTYAFSAIEFGFF